MSHCSVPASAPAGAAPRSGPRVKTVALVGPPNSGKSTLFNLLTGLRQKVANYPGVTVEHRHGRLQMAGNKEIELIDLPGIYSLDPRSEDERVTRDVLAGRMEGIARPDAVILILDATNLARHLALAAPILSLGLPTLVTLNMADDLRSRGGVVDTEAVAQKLGAPVALISATREEGIELVAEFLSGDFGVPAPVELPVLNNIPTCRAWATRVSSGAYHAPAPPMWSRRLDALFLHPVAGPAIFALVVLAVFQAIFSGAAPLMDSVESGIVQSGQWVASALPGSMIRDLLIEGVWGGVGSVVVFLPQILLLFLFIGILEDSGYLARAAVIADRTMSRAGLQG